MKKLTELRSYIEQKSQVLAGGKALSPFERGQLAAAKRDLADAERRAVYEVIAANGPDVDMHSPAFGRLVGRIRKASALTSSAAIYKWLEAHGMFGRASDSLRAPGDKYWP